MRYEAVYGFNTNQWWAYDNETGDVIDPPTEVLMKLKGHTMEEQERILNGVLVTDPDWLNDNQYRYGLDFDY